MSQNVTAASGSTDVHIIASNETSIPDISRNEFNNFCDRGRQLSRMTSEQALDIYLNQHNVSQQGSTSTNGS